MTLQEVLRKLDRPSKLAKACVANDLGFWKQAKRRHRKRLFNVYMYLIRRWSWMTTVEPETDYTLVPSVFVSDGEISPDASMYKTGELMNYLKGVSSIEVVPLSKEVLQGMTLGELVTQDAPYKSMPQSYAYTYSPWAEILVSDVLVPKDFTAKEMLIFLAQVLYEMTFLGYTAEKHKEEQDKLDRRCKEVEEAAKLPEEEQAKFFIPWDPPSMSPKEEEQMRHDMYVDAILWGQITLRMMKRIAGVPK